MCTSQARASAGGIFFTCRAVHQNFDNTMFTINVTCAKAAEATPRTVQSRFQSCLVFCVACLTSRLFRQTLLRAV